MTVFFVRGRQGTGKTIFLTLLGWLMGNLGTNIFSTYRLNFNHYPVIHPSQIQGEGGVTEIRNGLFLGDELWNWLDCWNRNLQTRFTTTAMMRVRKNQLDVAHSAQFYMQPVNRVREHTDYYIKMPNANYTRLQDNGTMQIRIFQYAGEHYGQPILHSLINQFDMDAKKLYHLYDTYEPTYSDMPLNMLQDCLEKQGVFDELLPYFEKIIKEREKAEKD